MRSLIFVLALSPTIPLAADELDLTGGGRLTGVVRSISADGIIKADLQIAEAPVEIQADRVTQVRFSKGLRTLNHDTLLTLINGDRLPCDITAISESDITVSTDYADSLTVPRKFITNAQLGIRPRKTIYSGPANLKHWVVENNWHYEDGAMVSDGRGSISREFDKLPDSYSLSFRLTWAEKPMFKAYFSSANTNAMGSKHDRYCLQVGATMVELSRQSSGNTTSHSLITVNRNYNSFDDREAQFEIRIDHHRKRIMLYIDGQLEGQAADPLPKIPAGKIVVLQSETSDAEAHRVSEIKLMEWDAAGERHRSEDRGETGEDALINNKGERIGGDLLGSSGVGNDMIILIKSPFAPEALEIPAPEVSTLFFKEAEPIEPDSTPLILGLTGAGSLGATDCTFGGESVDLNHPLLGRLSITRDVIKLLQRREWPEDLETRSDETPAEE
ncbi:hypothetical protein [Haloferula sp.]|uniref:hypothetical protein n=1 Tax=Haloferula sp. TaxID=2497595 RepID=UPI003C75F04F